MTPLERALRVVSWAARLVPRWRRDEWTREWTAELSHEATQPDSRVGRRAFGSLRDALSLRRHAMQLDLLWNDVRLACRTLRHRPGFAALVALTLAIGLGVNGAVFSLVDAVLLRPLPYPDAGRLVFVWMTLRGDANNLRDVEATPFDYAEWHRARSFDALAMVAPGAFTIAGDADPEPERVHGARVTASTLPLLGLAPVLGRGFTAAEDVDAAPAVVVLSDGLWRRRYGANPSIIGTTIRLDGTPHTVVGVMPAGASLPASLAGDDEIWLPARMTAAERTNAISHNYTVLGRLAPGVSLAPASAEMSALAADLAARFPATHGILGTHLVAIGEQRVQAIRPALVVLVGAVVLLLLVACANVATLLLARASGRRGEMAIRTALGAGTGRLLSIATAETIVLSLVGGAGGVALGDLLLRFLLPLFAGALPHGLDVASDARTAAWTLGTALAIGALLGVGVVAHRPFGGMQDALKAGGRAGTAAPPARARSALVFVQVSLSVVLLSAAALMLRSYSRLAGVNPGFSAGHLLTFHLALSDGGYATPQQRTTLVNALLDRLRSPEVRTAAVDSRLPFSGNRGANEVEIEGYIPRDAAGVPIVDQREVTPDYFRAMEVPVLEGRGFTARDDARGEPVAVVNRTMARRYWGDGSPIDRRVRVSSGIEASGWLRIVGVVGDVRHSGLARPVPAELYRPFAQMPMTDFFVVMRTAGEPAAVAALARSSVHSLDPALPLYDVRTMDERIAASVAQTRATALLLLVMAGVAALLAAIAIYGSIWYAVSLRLPEIGLRLALGATPRAICVDVLSRALALTAAATIAGTAAALVAGRSLRGLLFDTAPTDPNTYAIVVGLLLALTVIASLVPARRAMRVDPAEVLRQS